VKSPQQTSQTHSILNNLILTAGCLSSLGLLIWSVRVIVQSSYFYIPWDLAPLLVSFGFWVVGVAAWFRDKQTVTVLFFYVSASSLAVGLISGIGSDLAGRLFYILLVWLAPLLFQFHITWVFPSPWRSRHKYLAFWYLFALAFSIPFVFFSISELQNFGWFTFLRMAVRVSIVISMIISMVLLSLHLRNSNRPTTRHRIRFIFSCIVLAFSPLLLLSLLPDLLGVMFIPYSVNFVWLLIIPLSYGYTMAASHDIRVERTINHFIIYYLAAVLFAGGYLIIAEISRYIIPDWAYFWSWAIAGLAMFLLFLLSRINQPIRQLANWILYGSENHHLELLTKMADSLYPVLDRDRFRQILVEEMASNLSLTGSVLFLKGRRNNLVLEGVTGFDWQMSSHFSLPEKGALITFLKGQGRIIENEALQNAVAHVSLVSEEVTLLSVQSIGLWIPLVSGDEMHGLLVLGDKCGDALFDAKDRQTLLILVHQAGIAAHNLLLAESLQASRDELAVSHQQLLYAREKEKQQIACELHDNVVQQLLGISYHVVDLRKKISHLKLKEKTNYLTIDSGMVSLRDDILHIITKIRETIGELRPAGLNEFGLGGALEGFVYKMQHQAGRLCPQIELNIEQNDHRLSDSVEICLFRVSQEALRNVLKHANAKKIKIHLFTSENEVQLEILDDGSGFVVPARLSELVYENHFGLVGIAERVDWVNGHLEIRSQPGQGTQIQVRVPL
jgi:signal transduction histidine kinase